MTNTLALLGATGSIGTQVLDVVRRFPGRFRVKSLAAGKNLALLAVQIREFQPDCVAIQDRNDVFLLRELLRREAPAFQGEILAGPEGLDALVQDADIDTVVVGLVGMIGLAPSLTALKAGKKLLTANKETFVAGGHLVQPYLDRIIPVDSEHVAVHQCLHAGGQYSDSLQSSGPQSGKAFLNSEGEKSGAARPMQSNQSVRRIYLTASGGPFRNFSLDDMANVTLEQALKHPNWVMGRKITIDSATLMNKGLEVIEAHWLFGLPYEQIDVLVHPESVIHGGVEFVDGSVVVQMGATDMRGPIQYALTYPERLPNEEPAVALDLLRLSRLNLEPPDFSRFPCLRLAYEAGRLGGGATAVLNGADEAAVGLFLERKISFLAIPQLLEATLTAYARENASKHPTLEEVTHWDQWSRDFVANQATQQNRQNPTSLPPTFVSSPALTF